MKKITLFSTIVLTGYLAYAFVFSVIIYAFKNLILKEKHVTFSGSSEHEDRKSKDRVQLLESPEDGVIGRIRLIESATESIDISYFTFRDGKVSRMILGSILDAANRGVEVRLLFDGLSILASLTGEFKHILYGLLSHQSISLKFYDPVNPLFPFNWNKRLHDKMIIIDDHLALLGGRNVADNYYFKDTKWKSFSKDRDVIIFKDDSLEDYYSVIQDMKNYYTQTWNYKYARPFKKKLNSKDKARSNLACDKLEREYAKTKESFTENPSTIDWHSHTFAVENIVFVHNPVGKVNQDPWCLRELLSLSSQAKESIVMQSPYIIPTRRIKSIFDQYDIDLEKATLLTNSHYSSPNYLSIAAYTNHRQKIIDHNINIHEYQGEGSLHGKTYLFDNHISVIGSFNLDARSSFINSESMVVISSHAFSQLLLKSVQVDLGQSLKVGIDSSYVLNNDVAKGNVPKLKKVIIIILSKVTPILEHLL